MIHLTSSRCIACEQSCYQADIDQACLKAINSTQAIQGLMARWLIARAVWHPYLQQHVSSQSLPEGAILCLRLNLISKYAEATVAQTVPKS